MYILTGSCVFTCCGIVDVCVGWKCLHSKYANSYIPPEAASKAMGEAFIWERALLTSSTRAQVKRGLLCIIPHARRIMGAARWLEL